MVHLVMNAVSEYVKTIMANFQKYRFVQFARMTLTSKWKRLVTNW